MKTNVNNIKFIFIHLPKTGGTSIANALKSEDVLMKIHKEKHFTTSKITDSMLNDENVKILTCIRNPYSQIYSHYQFNFQKRKIKKINTQKNHPWRGINSLKDFVIRFKNNLNKKPYILSPESQLMRGGQYIVDDLIRFESLNEDFEKFCEKYNLNTKLKHHNKNEVKKQIENKNELYDSEMRNIIDDIFKFQMELGNYSYEQWLNS